ncbi:MAG: hypothetical protein CMO01_07735 [Thalassobius sp.]|nr:hypothetical protein [Thalassovita sp.]
MKFFHRGFEKLNTPISSRIYQSLKILISLQYPIKSKYDLEFAIDKCLATRKYNQDCKKLIVSSMSNRDFPIKNKTDAIDKLYIVLGEVKPSIDFKPKKLTIAEKLDSKPTLNYYSWIDFLLLYQYSNN